MLSSLLPSLRKFSLLRHVLLRELVAHRLGLEITVNGRLKIESVHDRPAEARLSRPALALGR